MRTMLRSHFKLLVIVSGVLLAVAGMALADQLTPDGDALDANVNGTPVALGDVDPGQTITKEIGFSLRCQSSQHVERGKSVKLSYTATGSVIPTGGSLTGGGTNATPTDATIGPIPNTWPLDTNNNCPAAPNDTLTSSPNSNVELKAPKASGAKSFTVNYNITELNADGTIFTGDTNTSGNFTSINGSNTRSVQYTMNVRNLPPVIDSIDGTDPVVVNDQKQYTINASDPNDDALTYTTSVSGPATIVSGNNTATPTLNFTGTGSVVLTAIARDTANNASAPKTKTITVNSAIRATTTSLSSSSTNNTSTYGEDVTFTATVTATGGNPTNQGTVTFMDGSTTLCSGVVLSSGQASCGPTSALGAGNHAITAAYSGTSSGTPQFGASTGSLTQTVNKAPLSVTANSRDKVYGDALTGADFSGTITGIKNNDPITASYSSTGAAATSDVNTYPIVLQINATAAVLANYEAPVLNNGTLTVKKAPITIKANDVSRYYGQANNLTYTIVSGSFKNGDLGNGVSVDLSTTATATSTFGPYPITVALSGTKAGNYALTAQNGTLTITAWTNQGFFAPVDYSNTENSVKGGATVPLKFRVFQGTQQLTSTSIVSGLKPTVTNCLTGVPIDDIEELATGGTSLRYDTTGSQFIFNWQTPKKPGTCYNVTVQMVDGSTIPIAKFLLK